MRLPDSALTMSTDRRDRSRDKARPRDRDDVIRPPRPPCWQDFATAARSGGKSLSVSDLRFGGKESTGSVPGSGSSCAGGSNSGSRRHNHQRHGQQQRRKNKLHRTRSEVCLSHCGLTEEDFTQNIADLEPRQLGIGLGAHQRSLLAGRLYFDESMARCQRWVAQVKASAPLEDLQLRDGLDISQGSPQSDIRGTNIRGSMESRWNKSNILQENQSDFLHNNPLGENSDVELEIPDESGSGFSPSHISISRLNFPSDTIAEEEIESVEADDVTISCDDVTIVPHAQVALPRSSQSKRLNGKPRGQGRSRSHLKDKDKAHLK